MPTPARAPLVDAPTPARAYILERRLLRAYDTLYQQQIGSIWHAPSRRAAAQALMQAHVGEAYARRWGEKRLSQEMPELIQRLTLAQQPQLAAVLLVEEPDLGAVVALLVKLERNLNYRDDDPRLAINDDARLKAAGLGRLSRQQYDARLKWGPLLELTPWVPALRTGKRVQSRRPASRQRARQVSPGQLWLEFPGGGSKVASL